MRMSKKWYVKELKDYGDSRGQMCVIESMDTVPFEIKRIFYDYNTVGSESRGNHANKNSSFAFISIAGSCVVKLNDGKNQETVVLNSPRKMLIINPMVWKEMNSFSDDNVLMVISDHHYDVNEYVNSYKEYIKYAKQGDCL